MRRRGREVNGRFMFVQKFVDLTACFCGGDVSRVGFCAEPVAETVRGVGGHGCGASKFGWSNDIEWFFMLFIYMFVCIINLANVLSVVQDGILSILQIQFKTG